jgi:hypothetical protein
MTRSARPSGFKRQRMTIAGLMMIIGLVAFYAWFIRTMFAGGMSLSLLFGIVVSFPLIGAPLLIKWRQWVRANPTLEPIDPGSEEVPLRVAESIAETEPKLESIGFRSLGHFRTEDLGPAAATFVTLLESATGPRTAQFFTIFAARGPFRKVATVLAFRTEFTDGTSLFTGNSRIASAFPRVQIREGSMSFPTIEDPRRLYDIHEASVAHYASDGIPVEPDIQDPAEFLRSSNRRELAGLAELGYLRLDEERQVYRFTWKGAFLVAWRLVWPVRSMRQMLRRRKAARMLRELGRDRPAREDRDFDRVSLPQ